MPSTHVPRPEHPNPQLRRDDWLNLNGTWSFAFDFGRSGREAGLPRSTGFDRSIVVPFCPESSLSGVGHTDFIPAMWYHRTIRMPQGWAGRRILLHFGGVDYQSEVYVDGRSVGLNFGGGVGFVCDITDHLRPGRDHHLVVRVHDDVRSGHQPAGKQSARLHSHGCHYTRVTGIWQTVWLEAVAPGGIRDLHIASDLAGGRLIVTPRCWSARPGLTWGITADDGAKTSGPLIEGTPLVLQLDKPTPWSPDNPHLVGLTIEVRDDGQVIDRLTSYAGLRQITWDHRRVYLNGEPIFLRLVLDQGYYPDGIWTAPDDGALRRDIDLARAAGFNGARLHQKVFEPRFHYWADRLGYLTWGESASWGVRAGDDRAMRNFFDEWRRIVVRDRNHPSIIAWTPFNEVWPRPMPDDVRRSLDQAYDLTRAIDPTRPVNTASGGNWSKLDLVTFHDYAQAPATLAAHLADAFAGGTTGNVEEGVAAAADRPRLLDEFGGTWWNPAAAVSTDRDQSWGYGNAPASVDDWHARVDGLARAVVDHPDWAGYCYTQLTDVEQEQNGVYFYDRSPKFDPARLGRTFSRRPDWSRW